MNPDKNPCSFVKMRFVIIMIHNSHTPHSVFIIAISGVMNRNRNSCVNKANTVDHC